ncbi:MAG: hypothetical protein J0L93_05090 [Deltaproteobacteria bacterium]|nr:hypothetical protein [Deltaproteobacteria bacterium]
MKNVSLSLILLLASTFGSLKADTMKVAIVADQTHSSIAGKISDCLNQKISSHKDMEIVTSDSESWDIQIHIDGLALQTEKKKVLGEAYFIAFSESAFFGTNSMERKLLIRDLNNNARAKGIFKINGGNEHLLQRALSQREYGYAAIEFIESQVKKACDSSFESLESLIPGFQLYQTFYKEHPVDGNQ